MTDKTDSGITVTDGTGQIIRDVEEYDERTGNVTQYLHDPKTGERLKNDAGRFVTYQSRRPKPLTITVRGIRQ